MRKEKLNELLDSIYELEGLVHLAISRDDEPAMLPELIRRKSREMMEAAERVTSSEAPTIHIEPENYPEPAAPEANVDEPEEPPYNDDSNYGEEPHYIEQEEIVPFAPERAAAPSAPVVSVDPIAPAAPAAPATPIVREPAAQKPHKAPEKETYKFDDFVEPRGRLVFSINDRYRFKRELFKGSDVDFNTTLALVASMDGYEEAEDYFFNELHWDEKSPEVLDFLEILKNYYK